MLTIASLIYAALLFYHSRHDFISLTTQWFLKGTAIASAMLSIYSGCASIFWIARVLEEHEFAEKMLAWTLFTSIPMTVAVGGMIFSAVPMFIKDAPFSWKPYVYVSMGMLGAWWLLFMKLILL